MDAKHRVVNGGQDQPQNTLLHSKCVTKLHFQMDHQLTWGLQGFFPLSICLRVDVTGDVVKGEKKVVLFMKLSRKLNLHLGTQQHVMGYIMGSKGRCRSVSCP